jgi:hypothetical protein
MSNSAPLAVVVAPESSDEAARCFSALLSAGFHPSIDYGEPGAASALANFPILAPLAELKEAQAFLRGLRAGGKPPRTSIFYSGSDRPVGPLPPEDAKGNLMRALGVLLALVGLGAAITLVLLALQFLGSLGHAPHH